MSEKGLNARSEAIAELSQIVHELECDPNNKKIIFDAENEDLSETERANLVEIKRKFERTEVIPKELLKQNTLLQVYVNMAGENKDSIMIGKVFSKLKKVVTLA